MIDQLRDRAFTASGLGGIKAGWFTFGTVEWASGANAGRRAEVIAHDLTDGIAVLTLLKAPVRAIAHFAELGQRFRVIAGTHFTLSRAAVSRSRAGWSTGSWGQA
ncbi:phage BR0599 family protein [Paracoccus sp. (in: a-proteobacteria)]|uniref:phage BR0599 family protein n=1 Tax=Paracoccus sp. TaxID=267 RepID=UPI0032205EBF